MTVTPSDLAGARFECSYTADERECYSQMGLDAFSLPRMVVVPDGAWFGIQGPDKEGKDPSLKDRLLGGIQSALFGSTLREKLRGKDTTSKAIHVPPSSFTEEPLNKYPRPEGRGILS
jgi:hypothetical protein